MALTSLISKFTSVSSVVSGFLEAKKPEIERIKIYAPLVIMTSMAAYQAYRSVCLPVDPYERSRENSRSILRKNGLSDDVKVIDGDCPQAEGLTRIVIPLKLEKADRNAARFILKHEISHIKNWDIPFICGIKIVTVLSIELIKINFFKDSRPLIRELISLPAVVLPHVYIYWREGKADDYAVSVSTSDELRGGIRFFKALREKNKLKRIDQPFGRILFSSSGEDRTDIDHPRLESRIRKLEQALLRRGESLENQTIRDSLELARRIGYGE